MMCDANVCPRNTEHIVHIFASLPFLNQSFLCNMVTLTFDWMVIEYQILQLLTCCSPKWSFHNATRNAITLVWGSLRLTPIMQVTALASEFFLQTALSSSSLSTGIHLPTLSRFDPEIVGDQVRQADAAECCIAALLQTEVNNKINNLTQKHTSDSHYVLGPFQLYSCLTDFLSNGMQSVDWHKYINLILYTMPHFLSEFFRKLCQAAYWEWHGRFALVNQHESAA